jgi:hypothetical protein
MFIVEKTLEKQENTVLHPVIYTFVWFKKFIKIKKIRLLCNKKALKLYFEYVFKST